MGNKFANLTLVDLPSIVGRILEIKYDSGVDHAEVHTAVEEHILALDEAMADWAFTTRIFLRLQKEFDELEEIEISQGWKDGLRQKDFIKLLTQLDRLDPEGEKAREHFGTMSALAEQARRYVVESD